MKKLLKPVYHLVVPYNLRNRISKWRYYSALRTSELSFEEGVYSWKEFDRYECIFIHIPKTGGISVSKSLFPHLIGHHTVQEYKKAYGKKLFEKYFKFTFVRNPWDRLVSAFWFLKAGGVNRRDKEWAGEHLASYNNFDRFVKSWLNSKSIYSHIHFVPQYEFICNKKSRLEVDFVGYFENFEQDFQFVREKLGICTDLSRLNASRRTHYKNYYDIETIEIVADVYQKDIEIFGYDFENGKRSP